jgi:flagellar biosynthetic protein FliR
MPAHFNVFGLTPMVFETYLLTFVRIGFMLALVPIFSQTQIPLQLKFAITLILTLVIAHVVPALPAELSLGELVIAILSQMAVGLVYGFVAFLLFTGIQFAGSIIDIQIGFAAVNIINPQTSQSVTIVGEFELALATLLYLAIDGHHQLIAGMAGSFNLVPLPYANVPFFLEGQIGGFFAQSLFMVFQIAAPVTISLFLVNITLGLLARVAPQMNVFVVGLPLQIGIGLVMMIVAIPLMGAVFPALLDQSRDNAEAAMRTMMVVSPTPFASASASP